MSKYILKRVKIKKNIQVKLNTKLVQTEVWLLSPSPNRKSQKAIASFAFYWSVLLFFKTTTTNKK
jgi:hypothetical protein